MARPKSNEHATREALTPRGAAARAALLQQVGAEVVRFQEASNRVDTVAARLLGVDRRDLPVLTLLLFGGPAGVAQLAGATLTEGRTTRDMVSRLELAGYVRRRGGAPGGLFEVTEHAREWIAQLWDPLAASGPAMFQRCSLRDLRLVARVLGQGSRIQESHAYALLQRFDEPGTERPAHRRGGLSPAALHRVQLFIESNLHRPLRARELADRAGLSQAHFARAFRATVALTPRAFVEQQRIARARELVETTGRPLADIAGATGFVTQSRLTSAFKRAVGFTPGVLRRATQTQKSDPDAPTRPNALGRKASDRERGLGRR